MQPGRVEPVDPFQRRQLDVCERLPRALAVDLLGLEQTDRRLGEGVVVRIADGSDGGVDAGGDQALGEGKAEVLTAVVVMMYEPCAGGQPGVVAAPERHLQR